MDDRYVMAGRYAKLISKDAMAGRVWLTVGDCGYVHGLLLTKYSGRLLEPIAFIWESTVREMCDDTLKYLVRLILADPDCLSELKEICADFRSVRGNPYPWMEDMQFVTDGFIGLYRDNLTVVMQNRQNEPQTPEHDEMLSLTCDSAGRFKCPRCSKVFTYPRPLARHLEHEHREYMTSRMIHELVSTAERKHTSTIKAVSLGMVAVSA